MGVRGQGPALTGTGPSPLGNGNRTPPRVEHRFFGRGENPGARRMRVRAGYIDPWPGGPVGEFRGGRNADGRHVGRCVSRPALGRACGRRLSWSVTQGTSLA